MDPNLELLGHNWAAFEWNSGVGCLVYIWGCFWPSHNFRKASPMTRSLSQFKSHWVYEFMMDSAGRWWQKDENKRKWLPQTRITFYLIFLNLQLRRRWLYPFCFFFLSFSFPLSWEAKNCRWRGSGPTLELKAEPHQLSLVPNFSPATPDKSGSPTFIIYKGFEVAVGKHEPWDPSVKTQE